MSSRGKLLRLEAPEILTLLLLPALAALGVWQLQRAEEKRALLENMRIQDQAPPVDIRSLDLTAPTQDLHGMRVFLRGHYDNQRVWFLDNRMHHRRIGFEAITPFLLSGGMTALVNRGWRAGDPARRRPPELGEAPEEFLQLSGRIHRPRKKMLLLAPEPRTRAWPRLIQRVDMEKMRLATGGEVFPHLVRLDPEQPGVQPADWKTVTISPARHLGYALTWFALAAALLLLQALRLREKRLRRKAYEQDA